MLAKKNVKIIFSLLVITLFTGCSFKDFHIKEVSKPEKKPFVYERKKIDEKLLNRTNSLVQALLKNQLNVINKDFIHQEFGFYNLYKVDGKKQFIHQKQVFDIVDQKTEEISHLVTRTKKYAVKTPILKEDVEFKCSPLNDKYYGWTKEGIFLNDKTKNYLSSLMKEKNTLDVKTIAYTKDDFHKAKLIEKTGYKLVVTPELIVYLTYIDNDWYISLIDRITTNCYEKKKKVLKKIKKVKTVKKKTIKKGKKK